MEFHNNNKNNGSSITDSQNEELAPIDESANNGSRKCPRHPQAWNVKKSNTSLKKAKLFLKKKLNLVVLTK